jgi:N-glycosylase/DNA lyase
MALDQQIGLCRYLRTDRVLRMLRRALGILQMIGRTIVFQVQMKYRLKRAIRKRKRRQRSAP